MSFLYCAGQHFNCESTLNIANNLLIEKQKIIDVQAQALKDKDKTIAYISGYLDQFKNHNSAVYGLADLKVVGKKCETYEIQRKWDALGVKECTQQQLILGRAYYRVPIAEMVKFLSKCPVHQFKAISATFDCNDYAPDMMGQVAMALWATNNREWYNAVLGICRGQQKFLGGVPGQGGHFWNWFWPADDDNIWYIDYLTPPDSKFTAVPEQPTKIYRYNPAVNGIASGVVW